MRADGKEKAYTNDKIEKQNPPKYELLEDLANMTYLSEASVVYNLSERYVRFLIYTYSGKFDHMNPKCTLALNSPEFESHPYFTPNCTLPHTYPKVTRNQIKI